MALIAYALHGLSEAPVWVIPDREQIVCSYAHGGRSIVVGENSRHDALPGGSLVIQCGRRATVVAVDCEHERCSFAFLHAGRSLARLAPREDAVLIVPFSRWTVVDRDRCLQERTRGLLTVDWAAHRAVHITVTAYGRAPGRGESERGGPLSTPSPPEEDFLQTILKESDLYDEAAGGTPVR